MAAASTAGALKAAIESSGLALSAHRDQAPAGVSVTNSAGLPTPYCVVHEAVSLVPDPDEDGGPVTAAETVQVDLWQMWRRKSDDPSLNRRIVENYDLPEALLKVIANTLLLTAPKHVYGVSVTNVLRTIETDVKVLDPGDNTTQLGWGLVHHAYTVRIRRSL